VLGLGHQQTVGLLLRNRLEFHLADEGPGTAARPRCRRWRPLAGRTCACRKRSGANLSRARLSLSWASGR
jgi:hypothetical protein